MTREGNPYNQYDRKEGDVAVEFSFTKNDLSNAL
jgi:hypothetical protein